MKQLILQTLTFIRTVRLGERLNKISVLAFLLLCYIHTGCMDANQSNEGIMSVNMKERFGISGYQHFSCILDSSMHSLYVINADTLYHCNLENGIITKQSLVSNTIGNSQLLHRLVYYELSPAILSYYYDKAEGVDSILYIGFIQRDNRVGERLSITIENKESLKDQYLITGVKYITKINQDSLIVSCNQSINYVIYDKKVSYYMDINGNNHILDPYNKQVISLKKCYPSRNDCYMYNENLRDTILVRAHDSIFSKFDYMGNPLIVNSTIFSNHGRYYKFSTKTWSFVKANPLNCVPVSNGHGVFWFEGEEIRYCKLE